MKKNYKYFLISLLPLLFYSRSYSQILVAGTSFDPVENESNVYYGIQKVQQYGFQEGSITVTPPLAVSLTNFNTAYQYAITQNPSSLDAAYINLTTPDHMLVVTARQTASAVNILEYRVANLVPGSQVTANVNFTSVADSSAPCHPSMRVSFRGVINPDQFNQNNGTETMQVPLGSSGVATFTGLVNANGEAVLRLNAFFSGSCYALGISRVEISGTPQPPLRSREGAEVCAGEFVTLESPVSYNGTYNWQVNEGSAWRSISTARAARYETTINRTYKFRLLITTLSGNVVTSKELSVAGITCCTMGNPPVPASRWPVYIEDFGRVDLTDPTGRKFWLKDYTDPLNPKEVAVTTTTPFRRQLDPAPPGTTFKATGPVDEGSYTVAAYMTTYQSVNNITGAMLQWSGAITGPVQLPQLSLDHSGKPDGAALLVNVLPNTNDQTLYRRSFSNICFGKQINAEMWIAVFTNAAAGPYKGVDVTLKLTDNGDPANTVQARGVATRVADGGGVWVKVSAQITLAGTGFTLDVINNSKEEQGNDLVIDDITVYTCAPPAVNIFQGADLSTEKVVCSEPLILSAGATAMLKNYYNGNPLYLFQWTRTPQNPGSWLNYGEPSSLEEIEISNPSSAIPFDGTEEGDKVYFRVVSASQTVFVARDNFTGVNHANIHDPCRNYSVSELFTAIKGADCHITGTEEAGKAEEVMLFPNPAREFVTTGTEVVSFSVTNALGETIAFSSSGRMDVSTWSPGIYSVLLNFKDGRTASRKLIVSNK